MARAVGHPCFGTTARQRQRDEGGTQVVDAHGLARRAPLEELRTRDAGGPEMRAQIVGPQVGNRRAIIEREHARLRIRVTLQFPPAPQGIGDAGVERPGAGILGLVFVERHHAALNVQIRPAEAKSLALAHPLAGDEPVDHAEVQRDARTREELRVFVGIEKGLGASIVGVWQPPSWQRVRFAESQGKDRKAEQLGQRSSWLYELFGGGLSRFRAR